jgi:hypothetical protein
VHQFGYLLSTVSICCRFGSGTASRNEGLLAWASLLVCKTTTSGDLVYL